MNNNNGNERCSRTVRGHSLNWFHHEREKNKIGAPLGREIEVVESKRKKLILDFHKLMFPLVGEKYYGRRRNREEKKVERLKGIKEITGRIRSRRAERREGVSRRRKN